MITVFLEKGLKKIASFEELTNFLNSYQYDDSIIRYMAAEVDCKFLPKSFYQIISMIEAHPRFYRALMKLYARQIISLDDDNFKYLVSDEFKKENSLEERAIAILESFPQLVVGHQDFKSIINKYPAQRDRLFKLYANTDEFERIIAPINLGWRSFIEFISTVSNSERNDLLALFLFSNQFAELVPNYFELIQICSQLPSHITELFTAYIDKNGIYQLRDFIESKEFSNLDLSPFIEAIAIYPKVCLQPEVIGDLVDYLRAHDPGLIDSLYSSLSPRLLEVLKDGNDITIIYKAFPAYADDIAARYLAKIKHYWDKRLSILLENFLELVLIAPLHISKRFLEALFNRNQNLLKNLDSVGLAQTIRHLLPCHIGILQANQYIKTLEFLQTHFPKQYTQDHLSEDIEKWLNCYFLIDSKSGMHAPIAYLILSLRTINDQYKNIIIKMLTKDKDTFWKYIHKEPEAFLTLEGDELVSLICMKMLSYFYLYSCSTIKEALNNFLTYDHAEETLFPHHNILGYGLEQLNSILTVILEKLKAALSSNLRSSPVEREASSSQLNSGEIITQKTFHEIYALALEVAIKLKSKYKDDPLAMKSALFATIDALIDFLAKIRLPSLLSMCTRYVQCHSQLFTPTHIQSLPEEIQENLGTRVDIVYDLPQAASSSNPPSTIRISSLKQLCFHTLWGNNARQLPDDHKGQKIPWELKEEYNSFRS